MRGKKGNLPYGLHVYVGQGTSGNLRTVFSNKREEDNIIVH